MSFSAIAYEALTIDNTSGGVRLTVATFASSNSAVLAVETASIRFTIDGTAPTSTVGTLVDPGYAIFLDSADQLQRFRAIRTGSSAGIKAIYGNADVDFKFGISQVSNDPSGGAAVTIADGADVNAGTTTDAAVAAGASGTISAKLRRLTTDLGAALTALAALVQKSDTVATTATLANVASSATNVTLQASNASRKGWAVTNDSTQVLYVKFAATASATSYTVQMAPGAYYELPRGNAIYTGIIDGIWAAANGNARVTEW